MFARNNAVCISRKLFVTMFTKRLKHQNWENAVSTAEKIIGYPTSFMNLRFWLSDEMSHIAINMRKLIGTKHPLMKTAKGLIFDDKESIQTRGLLVLLMSKAGGKPGEPKHYEHHQLDSSYCAEINQPLENGILKTQRDLAEITEMIHTAFVLHQGVIDINKQLTESSTKSDIQDLHYGNKMALLSGDLLFAKASVGLASLGNTYVVETMASAISDLMESRFLIDEYETKKNTCSSLSVQDWESITYKSTGCLYAKSCQAALMLSGLADHLTSDAFNYGRYFSLLQRLKGEYDNIKSRQNLSVSLYDIVTANEIQSVRSMYAEQAIDSLNNMQNVEAKEALKSFIIALT